MHYTLSANHPNRNLLQVEIRLNAGDLTELILRLPVWRPGRYEHGNFAKNVLNFSARDTEGNSLIYKKTDKSSWQIHLSDIPTVVISYSYYAAQFDAGACWVDEDIMYVNPIHCLMYTEEMMNESCTIELRIPASYKVATSLEQKENNVFHADDFHELVDSPFIAAENLQHQNYQVQGSTFHIWVYGECNPDWQRILNDFSSFTKVQIELFGSIPVSDFHFLVLLAPYKLYHGVEHLASTVLALGPGSRLMDDELYNDFTGVASHELFHVWNVKSIRPTEMLPYKYHSENYSRLGYVYEGVTTYYGDLILARCGVYSSEQFFKEINVRLQKHFHNYGRFNLSVADSSFDTWLDGYVPGVPDRKTSIYDEGCICALMVDLLIRKKSGGKNSLDDVMKSLYTDFAKQNIGYSEHDFMELVSQASGSSMVDFFMDYVYGTNDYEGLLSQTLSYAGCKLHKSSSVRKSESQFGFKYNVTGGRPKISSVAPGSPADMAGLSKDDEIVALNEIAVDGNLEELVQQFIGEKIALTTISPMKKLKDRLLIPGKTDYFPVYSIRKQEKADPDEQRFFKSWLNQDFYS